MFFITASTGLLVREHRVGAITGFGRNWGRGACNCLFVFVFFLTDSSYCLNSGHIIAMLYLYDSFGWLVSTPGVRSGTVSL